MYVYIYIYINIFKCVGIIKYINIDMSIPKILDNLPNYGNSKTEQALQKLGNF